MVIDYMDNIEKNLWQADMVVMSLEDPNSPKNRYLPAKL